MDTETSDVFLKKGMWNANNCEKEHKNARAFLGF